MIKINEDEDTSGFQAHVLVSDEDCLPSCTLYLPSTLAESLQKAKEQKLVQLRERHEAQRAQTQPSGRTSRPTSSAFDIESERTLVRTHDPSSYQGTHHPVYDAYAPVEMLARSRMKADKRDQERIEIIYRQLKEKCGNLRKIGWPDVIRSDLEKLALRFPHFKAVVQLVQGRLTVASEFGLPPSIPPILLTGDPGLGKTHFCRALGEVLQTPVRVQPFDNAETSSHLLGSDKHWGNTHHGLLFELLAMGTHANPVVVLDELDKSRPRSIGPDPLAPLHSILEPSTACAVRDLSLEFTLDASLVTFIATANDERRVPNTILSRFRVFDIQQPEGADAITVAHEVLCAVLQRFALDPPASSRRLAASLAHLTAREILNATEDAVTRMLAAKRRELLRSDICLDGPDQQPPWLH